MLCIRYLIGIFFLYFYVYAHYIGMLLRIILILP
jgi:hypothetical protein